MLVTPDQIRAARALKNWSQAELAEKVNMATPSIGNIESGKHIASPNTQAAILEVFDVAGVEFIKGGVRIKEDLLQVYEGPDCYMRFMDDAYRALVKSKGEILFSGSDERRSPPEIIEKFRSMRRSGITMRSLIRENDHYLMGELNEYRYMPTDLFVESDVKVIFGHTVGFLVSWQDVWKVIIIKDPAIANEAKRLFDFIWERGKKPEKTISKILYDQQG